MSAYHGWVHAPKELGGTDPLTGPWVLVINEGDTPPDQAYIELENGWEQPTAHEEFAFRRGGVNKLDFTGHLDSSGASSGTVAFTLPARYRLSADKFFLTVVYDGADPVPAMVFLDSSTGEVTITFPV
jgi:hypothetical protein